MKDQHLSKEGEQSLKDWDPLYSFFKSIADKRIKDAKIILNHHMSEVSKGDKLVELCRSMRNAVYHHNIEGMKLIIEHEGFDINCVIESHSSETALLYSIGYDLHNTDVFKFLLTYPGIDLFATNITGHSFLSKALVLKNYAAYQSLCLSLPESKVELLKQQVLESEVMNFHQASSWADLIERSFSPTIHCGWTLPVSSESKLGKEVAKMNVGDSVFDQKVNELSAMVVH
jgi:acetoin utilization deacetylase AcuC-like enzyme